MNGIIRKLLIGAGILILLEVGFFPIGRALWPDSFAPNYAASMAGAGVGGALSLIIVAISFVITKQHREKDLSYARFAFLRRQGEQLWQAYIAFCQSIGVDASPIDGATWNSAERGLWPNELKVSELHKKFKVQTTSITSSLGNSTRNLMVAYDDVFATVSDTTIFEGEHALARDITEAWREFGWACAKVQNYQSRIGWTSQNWSQISKNLQETSESVSKTISSLVRLATTVKLE